MVRARSRADWIWTAQGGELLGQRSPAVNDYFTSLLAGDVDGNGGEDLLWYASPGDRLGVARTPAAGMFGVAGETNIHFR